jgi:hypothetical protein
MPKAINSATIHMIERNKGLKTAVTSGNMIERTYAFPYRGASKAPQRKFGAFMRSGNVTAGASGYVVSVFQAKRQSTVTRVAIRSTNATVQTHYPDTS